MTPLSRKDVQFIVDTAKNQLIQRTASRQDMQTMMENARDRVLSYMRDFMVQNQQQFFRQLEARNAIYVQRLTGMESHIIMLENELKAMRQQMSRMAVQKPQQIIMPQPTAEQRTAATQYAYNPAA